MVGRVVVVGRLVVVCRVVVEGRVVVVDFVVVVVRRGGGEVVMTDLTTVVRAVVRAVGLLEIRIGTAASDDCPDGRETR